MSIATEAKVEAHQRALELQRDTIEILIRDAQACNKRMEEALRRIDELERTAQRKPGPKPKDGQ